MFRHYLTVALRTFARQRLYSFVNIAGMMVGLTCAIFICMFLRDELSYDAWQPDSGNIYQLTTKFILPGGGEALEMADASYPLGQAMKDGITEVEKVVRLTHNAETVRVGDKQFHERISGVDADFFAVIKMPALYGNPATVLAQPNNVIITQRTAQKYFGTDNPIGRTLTIQDKYSFIVAAVLANPAHNTQFNGDIFLSDKNKLFSSYDKKNWFEANTTVLVKLIPGADAASVAEKTKPILRRNADPSQFIKTKMTGDQMIKIRLVPMAYIHIDGGMGSNSGWIMFYGFAAIALLILAIAAFNFTNLATACATLRAREVALRKTMGASRAQLIGQYLSESLLAALFALILALALVEILTPAFDSLINRPIHFSYLKDWPLSLGAIAMALLTGLLGGIYPALVLSRLRPGNALKSRTAAISGSGRLRTALVVIQFAISIGLGIGALTVFAQINYAKNTDLGFRDDHIMIVDSTELIDAKSVKTFMDRLAASPAVAEVTASRTMPFGGNFNGGFVDLPGGQMISGQTISVFPGYFHLYGIHLLAGRDFSTSHGGDDMAGDPEEEFIANRSIIIDENMARRLGYTPQSAIGKYIRAGVVKHVPVRIIGVVGGVKYFGVARTMDPVIYTYCSTSRSAVSVRLKGGQIEQGVHDVDRIWHEIAPQTAIQHHFFEDSFNRAFESSERQGRLFGIFVGIAIFIACLGLFGLAAFTTERRAKEIGIRKVFGASRRDIIRMLLWQFSIPVLLANLIAWPLAYLGLTRWLQSYAYHIDLNPAFFILSGLMALLIASATVAAHAFKIASIAPIHALREE